MVLIGLMGKKYSGKDTASDIIVSNYNFKKISFAEPLKKICMELFNFSQEQMETKKETIDERWNTTPRTVLQYIGTEVFRKDINKIIPHIENNFWVKSLEYNYIGKYDNLVISDVRFQNEVDMIHKYGGIVIKLTRDNNNIDNHESESNIDYIINYDYVVNNNSTLNDLTNSIMDILKNIIN